MGLLITTCLLVAGAAQPADGEIVFSLRTWEGEYFSTDVPGGVERTPTLGSIFVVAADGTGLTHIAGPEPDADNPCNSPDGQWVYYQSRASGASRIYRRPAAGGPAENLTAGDRLGTQWRESYGFSLSADGAGLLYTVHDGQSGRVVLADADGSSPRFLLPELGYIYMAAFSPAGDRVVFSGPSAGYRLRLARVADGELLDLTPDHPESFVPRFTPDGRTVVFFRRDGDVYRVAADGGPVERLTEGNAYVEFRLSARDAHGSSDGPDISPDGQSIAYIAVKEGVPNVCVMDVDGGRQRQLTFRRTPCGRVRFSPSGDRIAFVSFEAAYPQLFTVPTAGGEPRQLTRLEGAVYLFQWKP